MASSQQTLHEILKITSLCPQSRGKGIEKKNTTPLPCSISGVECRYMIDEKPKEKRGGEGSPVNCFFFLKLSECDLSPTLSSSCRCRTSWYRLFSKTLFFRRKAFFKSNCTHSWPHFLRLDQAFFFFFSQDYIYELPCIPKQHIWKASDLQKSEF